MNRIEKTFMPIWQPFTHIPAEAMIGSLPDAEERGVALATHHYFQARYEAAAEESRRFLNSPCPEIRAAALLLHSMANVGLGNAELVLADFSVLKKAAQQPEDIQMAAIFDALRYLLAVFFHTDGEIEPLREEHAVHLPEGTRLYLLYAVAHVLYLQNKAHTLELMKRHAAILGPKFRAVLDALDREIAPLDIASWCRPKGGYFISLNAMPGTAKRTWELCREAGVVMTGAGATFPYGKDPADSNLRIAPTLPSVEELEQAIEVLCVCLKLSALEKLGV